VAVASAGPYEGIGITLKAFTVTHLELKAELSNTIRHNKLLRHHMLLLVNNTEYTDHKQAWTHLSMSHCLPKSTLSLGDLGPHLHTHPLNGFLSRTTWVSRYRKSKTNLDFTEARDSEWQWHQLVHMQVCTSLQTDNHASTPPLSFYSPDALPAARPTASKH